MSFFSNIIQEQKISDAHVSVNQGFPFSNGPRGSGSAEVDAAIKGYNAVVAAFHNAKPEDKPELAMQMARMAADTLEVIEENGNKLGPFVSKEDLAQEIKHSLEVSKNNPLPFFFLSSKLELPDDQQEVNAIFDGALDYLDISDPFENHFFAFFGVMDDVDSVINGSAQLTSDTLSIMDELEDSRADYIVVRDNKPAFDAEPEAINKYKADEAAARGAHIEIALQAESNLTQLSEKLSEDGSPNEYVDSLLNEVRTELTTLRSE